MYLTGAARVTTLFPLFSYWEKWMVGFRIAILVQDPYKFLFADHSLGVSPAETAFSVQLVF